MRIMINTFISDFLQLMLTLLGYDNCDNPAALVEEYSVLIKSLTAFVLLGFVTGQ